MYLKWRAISEGFYFNLYVGWISCFYNCLWTFLRNSINSLYIEIEIQYKKIHRTHIDIQIIHSK